MVQHPARRLILAGGFAIAIATAPAVALFTLPSAGPSAATIAACPPGELEDLYTDNCVPELSPTLPHAGAPSEQQLTACSGHDQGECTANEYYGTG